MPKGKPCVGLALGVYDFCHHGHVSLLKRAKVSCDWLVVAVHTDAEVRSYKGVQPTNTELERAEAVRALNIADEVVVSSDKSWLCRKFHVRKVFHGDDWDQGAYRARWASVLEENPNLELVLLPHTPGVSSTRIRATVPSIGWWLYTNRPEWERTHIFNHMAGLFERLGGVWIVNAKAKEDVRRRFPDAPCALLPERLGEADVAATLSHFSLKVFVISHFRFDALLDALKARSQDVDLVIVGHGRSGKPGTGIDSALKRYGVVTSDTEIVKEAGPVKIHDFYLAKNAYLHFDQFLLDGGKFTNPSPNGETRILVVPTWTSRFLFQGTLISPRWWRAIMELKNLGVVEISPHPLIPKRYLRILSKVLGVTVLQKTGQSFSLVRHYHVVVSELSGAFWEAMMFDTPLVMAKPMKINMSQSGADPALSEVSKRLPVVGPDALKQAVESLIGRRSPGNRELAERRLGKIDGKATVRISDYINRLLISDSE